MRAMIQWALIAELAGCSSQDRRAPIVVPSPLADAHRGCPSVQSDAYFPMNCGACGRPVTALSDSTQTVTLTKTSPAWSSPSVSQLTVYKGEIGLGCENTHYAGEGSVCRAPITYRITC